MSLNNIENQIVLQLRMKFNNNKITKKWIAEWSTSKQRIEKNIQAGEEVVELEVLGLKLFCAVKRPEKRKAE